MLSDCLIWFSPFNEQKRGFAWHEKAECSRQGSKSKCFQMRPRALKTKDGIMRNHNRKRQSGAGHGLFNRVSLCHAYNTCLKGIMKCDRKKLK